jgi:hypothetical protein
MGFELEEKPDNPNAEDLEDAVEALADYVITELGAFVDTASSTENCRLGSHALLTLARLLGFVPSGPPEVLLLQAYEWIQQVRANEASATARESARLRRCRARRKRDGQTCLAKPLPSGRCKLHGGMSTGPKTKHGRAAALANLRQNSAATTVDRTPRRARTTVARLGREPYPRNQ